MMIKKTFLIILLLLVCLNIEQAKAEAGGDLFFEQRKRMVKEQIEARGIKSKQVLDAMLKVKRHLFVPLLWRSLAYRDQPLPIGEGQTISQPYIVALMTEVLDLNKEDKVLEIGTGSGYQAAILAEIVNKVYTIEILPKLAARAEKLLNELGYENIMVKCGDGYLGWPEFAPFDAIIVTCAPDKIPQPLIEQLAENGRMVIPVGEQGQVQDLVLLKEKEGRLEKSVITGCLFVPMTREGEGKQEKD